MPPEDTGRRARPADAFGPSPEATGRRPRPPAGPGSREDTGRRPVPPSPAGPAPDDVAQRLVGPDATGRRPHPAGAPEDAGRRRPPANGAPGRRFAPDDPRRPDATGRRPRPDAERPATGPDGAARRQAGEPDGGPRRLAHDPAEGAPARGPADGSGPRRPAPGGPDAGPRRPVDGAPGGRRPPEGGPDGSGPRRLAPGGPDGSGPRRLAEDGPGPRRPVDGAPDGPRRPVEGAAEGPRRLADGPPEGPRRPAEGKPDPRRLAGEGPRRPAGGPDGSGPRPVGDGARRPAAAADGDIAGRLGAGAPEPREQVDPASLTTEMEAISDDVKKRREVDHTLARFSAVHDELAEQERQRKERRQKLMPWKAEHDDEATVHTPPVDGPDDLETPRRGVRTVRHSKIVRVVKTLSLTAAVLVFLSTGLGWVALRYVDSKINEIDALNENSAAVHEAEKQLGDENFLIVGSDTRAGAKPTDGVGDADAEPGARSDVLMLAHIPADRKRVVVVSVPRDLQITRPECEKWNWETGEYTGEVLAPVKGVKANQAYADGGPKCVSTFMTELTGLTINHFISVDFNGFKGMVDAVGKIKVCVPKVMDDEELGMIFDKPGQYEVDGQKALDYVRARYVKTEPLGDYDRVTRQQKFLSSLLRTALSSDMLLNPGKLNNFLNAFAASTVGQNIGVKDMLTLAQSLQGIEAGRVSFITVPHVTDEGPTKSNNDNIELLKVDETKALFQAIIDGTPLPGETPDAPVTPSPQPEKAEEPKKAPEPKQGKVVDPKGLKVQVFNGDQGNPGAAKRTKNALAELGFEIVNSGDGEPVGKTVIRYGAGGEDAAFTLAAAVPGATLEVAPTQGGAVTLIIGPGWDEKVVSPKPNGTGAEEPGKTTPPADLSIVNAGKDPCA
ncbi:LCP family protein [Saccharothrix australiensis]|uniref:LytR family transcriptional attenuator n=1 Tax=Saccharothrix australiensis TaxID=2072 RepID=A0A495VQH4_9PSEU|nr:LCP family protein [Saccharothrix australiensis]RKT51522.1 LytR family transcriptional attenuator [Saccharothrix australiensis]